MDLSFFWDKGVDDDKQVSLRARLDDDRVVAAFGLLKHRGTAEAWLFPRGVGAKVRELLLLLF